MKQLLALLLILFPISMYSQTNDYRLDSYVNPDYKRKELNFEFGTSGAITSYKSKYKTTGYGNLDRDSESQSLNGSLNSNWYQISNSAKKQATSNLRLNISGNYLNNGVEEEKDKMYGLSLEYDQNGYYYKKNKKFIEFSPYASFWHASSAKEYKGNNLYDLDESTKNTHINLSLKLGIGKGRIEQVGDARLAMYILSDLEKNKSLKKILNPDEINQLARQITSIKNKRQFDVRIKLIEEIMTVDSFLIANGYTEEEKGAAFYTSLYDNWMYAGRFERAAGSRFSIGIAPDYFWSHNKQKEGSTYDQSYYFSKTSVSAYVTYQYEKPANLYLQHSIQADLIGAWVKTRGNDKGIYQPYFKGSYSLGYYPNSRTHIVSSCFLNYKSRHQDDWNEYSFSSGLQMNLYYYLSPQLRLNAGSVLNFQYEHSKSDTHNQTYQNKYPDFSFNIGLQYSIF